MRYLFLVLAFCALPTFGFAEQAEIYHTPAEKRTAGLETVIAEHITVSALLEFEMGFESASDDSGNTDSSSDLALATAEFGVTMTANENLSGEVLFLYEDNGGGVAVDEAAINYERNAWNVRLGEFYLPFGTYPSHFVTGPLSADLGETRESAALLGYSNDLINAAIFLFNGDADKNVGEDHISDLGFAVTLTPFEDFEFGLSWLSDLADSDTELLYDDIADTNVYNERACGFSLYAIAALGQLEISAEVLGATIAFDDLDLDEDGDGNGDQPLTWNLELAWDAGDAFELAARVEGSEEFAEQPELQYGLCASWGLFESSSLALEYLHAEFDDDFSGTLDNRDTALMQLAVEF